MFRLIAVGIMVTMLSACVAPWGPMHGHGGRPHFKQDSGHYNVEKVNDRSRRSY